jgi:hypothetical protein
MTESETAIKLAMEHRGIIVEEAHALFCCTVNYGPVRIKYKCLVLIYVFPEMKLGSLVISKNRIIMFCLPIFTFVYL